MELRGSYCFEGRKGDIKATYQVRFKDMAEAKAHILKTASDEELVTHFWYGKHINDVNGAGDKAKTAQDAYNLAEIALKATFPSATFVRGVEKTKSANAELVALKALLTKRGMSIKQVEEWIEEQD